MQESRSINKVGGRKEGASFFALQELRLRRGKKKKKFPIVKVSTEKKREGGRVRLLHFYKGVLLVYRILL